MLLYKSQEQAARQAATRPEGARGSIMSLFVSFLVGAIFIISCMTMLFSGMIIGFVTNPRDVAIRIAIGQIAQLVAIVSLLHYLAW